MSGAVSCASSTATIVTEAIAIIRTETAQVPPPNKLNLARPPGWDRWASSVTPEETLKFIECENKYEKYFVGRDKPLEEKEALEKERQMEEECNPIVHLDKNYVPIH
jgi:hypothetical protein